MTPPPADRILVVCTRYLGDTILAVPFLRSLRRACPWARIDVRAEGAARALLADCPHVDGFVDWPAPAAAGPAGALAAFRVRAARVRAARYDRAYLLKPSLSAALLAAAAGIRHRVGFAAEGRLLLSRAVRVGPGRRQSQAYLDLLRCDGIAVDDAPGAAWVTADATAKAAGLVADLPAGRRRVFVALRSTDGRRHWPLDRWAALVTRLVVDHGCAVVLCGAPGDGGTHDDLRRQLPPAVVPHVHDLSARVSLRETAALVGRCDLCIGVDSGLVHLAAWCGVPVAVLYGPTDPDRWTPLGAPVAAIRAPRTRAGVDMDGIGVADVLGRALALLPAADRGPRTVDLRGGRHAYEVLVGSATSPEDAVEASAIAADVPATNPLAQAH